MGNAGSVSTLLLEYFNRITDYAERRPRLERDEDCLRARERDSAIATRVSAVFTCFRCANAMRGRVRAPKAPGAKRSGAAQVCAVLSALGRWPAGIPVMIAGQTAGRLGSLPYNGASECHRHLVRTGLGARIAYSIHVRAMAAATRGISVEPVV